MGACAVTSQDSREGTEGGTLWAPCVGEAGGRHAGLDLGLGAGALLRGAV